MFGVREPKYGFYGSRATRGFISGKPQGKGWEIFQKKPGPLAWVPPPTVGRSDASPNDNRRRAALRISRAREGPRPF